MPEPERLIAEIIAATEEKQIVGRIRLQKIVYLLTQRKLLAQRKDMPDFNFSYHHYGPYSRRLEHAILDAEAFGFITEERNNRRSDGASYSVFKLKEEGLQPSLKKRAIRVIQGLARKDVTVLELAATANWLCTVEKVNDWRAEIKKRKGAKIENGRLDGALKLLGELKLQPAEAVA